MREEKGESERGLLLALYPGLPGYWKKKKKNLDMTGNTSALEGPFLMP